MLTEANKKLTLANEVLTHANEQLICANQNLALGDLVTREKEKFILAKQKLKHDYDLMMVMRTMTPVDNEVVINSNFTIQVFITICHFIAQ